ncbi:hypothetical protein DUNSADRAFT_6867 [Dunaliella salina]|uniref:Protein kinase domain-containing protein n=1 Tax=Dunaliella salina TaxID=3046 RepID=A0ABQ7GME0_DUNSA|nr:hypothetical protein DUNSADRAFT_6867 [Dunaliella salina]|eukprot:KAF5835778.1 hypothetical protein DUNSADRAFT_6867 [Dunaliella salina]
MEDMLGREVQPEELQLAVQSMQGRSATVLQLAGTVDATSASTTGRTRGSDSFRGEEWVGDQADLGELLAGVYLSQYSQDGEEEEGAEGSQGGGAEASEEEYVDGAEEGDSFGYQQDSFPLFGRHSRRHHQQAGPSGEEDGGDDTEDQACCSSPRADLLMPSQPSQSTRSTPTPNVPSLSLNLLRRSIKMGPGPGQFTLRTRRRCDQALDPSMLRVLLPLVARKGAASKAARAAAGRHTSRRQPLDSHRADHHAHGLRSHRHTRLADKLEACAQGSLSNCGIQASSSTHTSRKDCESALVGETAEDVHQRLPGDSRDQPLRHARYFQPPPAAKSSATAASSKSGTAARAITEEEDVSDVRDTNARSKCPSVPRTRARASVRRVSTKSDRRRRSVAPHALGASWWADYALNEVEEEEEMLLPESMWSIHSLLQPGSSDRLSPRLSGRSQLAQTAYSIVYTATLDGEKTVVAKVLDVGCEDLMANAFAEASILDSLRGWHGCVQMLACGRTADGQVQLVLQKADTDLRHWAEGHPERHTPAWAMHAMRMFEKAASLVKELHEQGVAHCDIKADNLLLRGGELMLSDFSEAVAFMRPEQAILHESRGTEAYQCPEMFKGSGSDVRAADTWALGCLLLELVTGAILFPGPGDCLRPTMEQHINEDGQRSWLHDYEIKRVKESLHEDPGIDSSSSKASSVLELATNILVEESRRPTAAQVARRASAVLMQWQQSEQ